MFSGIGFVEMMVIAIVAVLLFGQRLPEVARNAGRGYRQLKQSLTELKSTIDFDGDGPETKSFSRNTSNDNWKSFDPMDDVDEPTAPKLAPPEPNND